MKEDISHKMTLAVCLLLSVASLFACPTDTIKKVNGPVTEIYHFPASVNGMVVDENGTLYFSDTYSKMDRVSRIYTLSPPYTGKPLRTNIEGKSIAGLMWHNNYLYVAFLGKNEVGIYDQKLEFQMAYEVDSPLNFTNNGEEVLVLNYFGTVSHLSRSGRVSKIIENLNNAFDIQFNGDQGIWISEHNLSDNSGQVLLYNYQGEVTDSVNHIFMKPAGLALDNKGNLFITDSENGEICRMSPSGKIKILSDRYKIPICVTTDHKGTIFVNSNDKNGMLLLLKNKR